MNGYSSVEPQLHTRDEILSAMVVYGFLSYHNRCLRIPNHELMLKFQQALSRESMGGIKQVVDCSREMLNATLSCDAQKVAAILEEVHDREIPFLKYGDENSLSCVVTLCYLYARNDYQIEREAKAGKGYCDYVFLPKKSGMPAIILELKVGKSCEDALEQIKRRKYLHKIKESSVIKCEEALLVGICYNGEKHHECVIEKVSEWE